MILSLLGLISGPAIISALIWLVGIGLCFWLLWWFLDYVKLPEPFNKVAHVILMLAAVVVLINIILSISGHPIVQW